MEKKTRAEAHQAAVWEGKLAAAKECVTTLQSEVKQVPLQLGSLTTQ